MNNLLIVRLTICMSCLSFVIDGVAIWLSMRANRIMEKAIKDLHESHDELHNVISRIG